MHYINQEECDNASNLSTNYVCHKVKTVTSSAHNIQMMCMCKVWIDRSIT